MKHFLNYLSDAPSGAIHGRAVRTVLPAGIAVVLAVSALGCSEGVSNTPGGLGGQASGGTAGSGAIAGNSNTPTAGTPSATSGAAGMPGTGGGGTGGSSGGTGGSSGSGGAGGTGGGGTGGTGGGGGSGGAGGDAGWIPLFNGTNLDGWTVYGTNETLFTVADGTIHTYPTQVDGAAAPQANMVHDTKLGGKYTLHVEYKWGEARFIPRANVHRDAGILFHIQGSNFAPWPHSIECQIGSSPVGADWVTGDLWVIGGPMVASVKNQAGQTVELGRNMDYASFSATAQAELPHGQWNIVDVIVNGAEEAIYMVNGKEVNRVYDMSYNNQPVSEGYISIQAEYAELFYRNIRYKVNP